jgi:hypothetical protein
MHGRIASELAPPYTGEAKLFAGVRVDGAAIEDARYSHSTFANVSFLNTHVRSGQFLDCVFVECYFRKAELKESKFVGCKFINCNFSHCTLASCDFRYADFRGSGPPYGELKYTAPTEPNLREELFSRLSAAAAASGNLRDARSYRIAAIDAQNDHLLGAVRADSTWYRDHYDMAGRVGALARLFWHYLNRYLWRHGESAWRLFLSAAVIVFLLFPLLLLLNRDGLISDGRAPSLADVLWLSLSSFLLQDRLSAISLTTTSTLAISAIEGFLGVIFAGMYVTLLVKALLRR